MKESRIERLIALDDYVKAIGLENGVGQLNIIDAITLQNQIEKLITDTLEDLATIKQFEQEDFDSRDVSAY